MAWKKLHMPLMTGRATRSASGASVLLWAIGKREGAGFDELVNVSGGQIGGINEH
jgi:hypothetical protein